MAFHNLVLLTVLILFSTVAARDKSNVPPRKCRVVIVGAGIGGAYTAWRLAVDAKAVDPKTICVFEAKQRSGGRILSVDNPVPGFDGYTVDLGAYRYNRLYHRHTKLVVEDVLKSKVQCYTDPLEAGDPSCTSGPHQIVSTRGRQFGFTPSGETAESKLANYSSAIPYVIPKEQQWGPDRPRKSARTPYDLFLNKDSVVPEIAKYWEEFESEKDYAKAMKLVDTIIREMRGGSYRNISYADIGLLQVAYNEGYTPEEVSYFLNTDKSVGDAYNGRRTVEVHAQISLRQDALKKQKLPGVRAMVIPVEKRGGRIRKKGMGSIVRALLERSRKAGVQIFYGKKVTGITRIHKRGKSLRLRFSDGSSVRTSKVILNIGKPDLIAMGLESEPLKSSTMELRRAIERTLISSYAKTYCFWDDAWWVSKLGRTTGRFKMTSENLHSGRYHDGNVVCKNATTLKGCRGALLVSYVLGDYAGASSAIYPHILNSEPYTPITNTDNVHRLIPGKTTPIQKYHFDDIHRQLRRVHGSTLKAFGLGEDAIPEAAGCVYADWRDVGVHKLLGSGLGGLNIFKMYTRPAKDLDISLVNEAWGQISGWAEASLHSAERALYHEYGLKRPSWMDKPFHDSVIKKFNQG